MILIGINFYAGGNARDHHYYNLRGCVDDINTLEDCFTRYFSVEKTCIKKLTASAPDNVDAEEPVEDIDQRPTYENMVAAFQSVTKNARSGDLVYIHYSGHGGKVSTTYKHANGKKRTDEALVPTDINTGGRYLRDWEIKGLLSEMIANGLIVTIALDCCHSGGCTRGNSRHLVRGIGKVDTTVLPSDKLSDVTLKNLTTLTRCGLSRNGESWLLESEGYELIAACRQNEEANELEVEDKSHGAFTYWLLEEIKKKMENKPDVNTTHGLLFDTISHSIRATFQKVQTPVFAGNAGRYFFGKEGFQHNDSFVVETVNDNSVTINTGKAHTGCVDTEYAIFPSDTKEFEKSNPLARVIVKEAKDLWVKAQIIEGHSPEWGDVKPGCRAILSARPNHLTRVKIPRHAYRNSNQNNAVERLCNADWKEFSTGVAPLVHETNDLGLNNNNHIYCATYNVMVNEHGEYELWTEGMKLIPYFPPCGDPKIFLRNVTLLSQYNIVKNLRPESVSELKGKFSFRVKGKLTPILDASARYNPLEL